MPPFEMCYFPQRILNTFLNSLKVQSYWLNFRMFTIPIHYFHVFIFQVLNMKKKIILLYFVTSFAFVKRYTGNEINSHDIITVYAFLIILIVYFALYYALPL